MQYALHRLPGCCAFVYVAGPEFLHVEKPSTMKSATSGHNAGSDDMTVKLSPRRYSRILADKKAANAPAGASGVAASGLGSSFVRLTGSKPMATTLAPIPEAASGLLSEENELAAIGAGIAAIIQSPLPVDALPSPVRKSVQKLRTGSANKLDGSSAPTVRNIHRH